MRRYGRLFLHNYILPPEELFRTVYTFDFHTSISHYVAGLVPLLFFTQPHIMVQPPRAIDGDSTEDNIGGVSNSD